jgi:hypothetical protein
MSNTDSPTFGAPGQTELPLLDVRASNARTALDDPAGLPDPIASQLAAAEARATSPDDNPYVAYAIDQLDEIINILNPAAYTRAAFAETLTMLGRHLAERCDELASNAESANESGGEIDGTALQAAADLVSAALDTLDEAIAVLVPDEED